MPFDISTAKPEQASTGFDISTAKPEGTEDVGNDIDRIGSGVDSVSPSNSERVEPETTIGEDIFGGLEVAGAVLSSAIAEPLAGISGLVHSAIGGQQSGVDAIKSVKDAFTFQPSTEAGKSQLQSVGEALQPIGEAISGTEKFLGESVLELTGSPELAAIAHTLPTAVLESLGLKGLRSTKGATGAKLSSDVHKAIQQASPEFNQIKKLKTDAYKELDTLGVKVRPQVYDKFADNIASKLKKEGVNRKLTPKSFEVLQEINSLKGEAKTLTELDTLRKQAGIAARDIDKSDARLGNIIIREIDKGLDSLSTQIGGKFKNARGLAQRAFKAQDMEDLIEAASLQASGFENGLRVKARQLLNNEKRMKGYTPDERAALKDLVKGDFASNTAKKLSRLGFNKGVATNQLAASSSSVGGGVLGSFLGGPLGALVGSITPAIVGGKAANVVERMTLNKVKFVDDLARAGKNAKAVTRTYLKHTPTKDRSVDDLTALLLHNNLDLDSIKSLPKSKTPTNKLVADAKFFAEEIKRRAKKGASAALIVAPKNTEDKPKLDFTISGGNKP